MSKGSIPVAFHHAPVPGGGFVTGFVFHPIQKDLLYTRTDIGGVYRYEPATRSWKSLCDGVAHGGRWETFPLGLALAEQEPDWLYIAAGDYHTNRLCISHDRGEHFTYRDIPAEIHGNAPGRGTGERLIVSRYDPKVLYFASQSRGLLITRDAGEHWEALEVCGEKNLTFCFLHPQNESVVIVGTTGEANRTGEFVRGPSLYLSTDGGHTFSVMPGQPAPILGSRATHAGYVAQRPAFDGTYLYVTMNMPEFCWAGFNSVACDTGTSFDGALLRYALRADGQIDEVRDITPSGFSDPGVPARRLGCGLSGVSVDPARPGTLILSTICNKGAGDIIYRSTDHGETFTKILQDLHTGHIDFTVPYMKPPYNGNRSIVHWMSDVKINPHDGNMAIFNTGTGIFATYNLLAADKGETVSWQPICGGLEETVHLNVYSPNAGRVQLIDIIGDLGGFAFEDLHAPCENSFADAEGNRYITCMNADFLDSAPAPVCVTARGNWTGRTTGGLILSDDDCRQWERLPMPYGLTGFVDGLLAEIERPNVNAGWVALSADGETIVWGVGQGNALPVPALVHTRDRGCVWHRSTVLDAHGTPIEDAEQTIKVFSDRVDAQVFYGFGKQGMLWVSLDGGATFHPSDQKGKLPAFDPTGIDGQQHFEIRPQAGVSGVFYVSAAEDGLNRVQYDRAAHQVTVERLTPEGMPVYRVGVGHAKEGQKHPALYINATIGGTYGFYVSFDGAATWQRIGDDAHLYGDIRSIAADPRTFGRFYVATGSRGVVWGDLLPG